MRKHLIALTAAFGLVCSTAQAASITITIGAMSKTYTVSAADTTRIVNALGKSQGQICSTSGTPPVTTCRDRTNQEVFDTLTANWMQALKDVVKGQEGDVATTTARAAVVDVVAN